MIAIPDDIMEIVMSMGADSDCRAILAYLSAACETDPRSEVSALELENELGLSRETVRRCLQRLVSLGAVQADLFPLNVWASLTALGPEVLARMDARAGPPQDEATPRK
jgi:DNA-binding IclR family transcriptional regulator